MRDGSRLCLVRGGRDSTWIVACFHSSEMCSQVFSRLLISPETAAKTVVKAGACSLQQLATWRWVLAGLQAATAEEGCVPAPPRLASASSRTAGSCTDSEFRLLHPKPKQGCR